MRDIAIQLRDLAVEVEVLEEELEDARNGVGEYAPEVIAEDGVVTTALQPHLGSDVIYAGPEGSPVLVMKPTGSPLTVADVLALMERS